MELLQALEIPTIRVLYVFGVFQLSQLEFCRQHWNSARIPTGILIGKATSFAYCLCLESIQDIKGGCKKSSDYLPFLV